MSYNDFITSILNIDSSKIKSLDTIQHSDTSIDVFITLNEESVSCPFCYDKVNSLFTKTILLLYLMNT